MACSVKSTLSGQLEKKSAIQVQSIYQYYRQQWLALLPLSWRILDPLSLWVLCFFFHVPQFQQFKDASGEYAWLSSSFIPVMNWRLVQSVPHNGKHKHENMSRCDSSCLLGGWLELSVVNFSSVF